MNKNMPYDEVEIKKRIGALVEAVKENLKPEPVCDSTMECPGWEANKSKIEAIQFTKPFKFCPWCGEEIVKKVR